MVTPDRGLCAGEIHNIVGASVHKRAAVCGWAHLLLAFPSVSSPGGLWPVSLGILLVWHLLMKKAQEHVSSREREVQTSITS